MLSHRSIISNPLWPQYCSSIQSKTSITFPIKMIHVLKPLCLSLLFHCAWKQSCISCFCFGSLPKLWISSYHPSDPNNTELSPACQTPVSNLCQVSIYIEFPYNSQTFKGNSQKLPFAKAPFWNSQGVALKHLTQSSGWIKLYPLIILKL